MPIPTLLPCGFLPAGIHTCTFDEIADSFGKGNPHPRRSELWGKCMSYVDLIRPFSLCSHLYIDGSFTTSKEVPGDIDLILEVPKPTAFSALPPEHHHLFDHDLIKRDYELDFYFVFSDGSALNDFRRFFQYIRPEQAMQTGLTVDDRKGILQVAL